MDLLIEEETHRRSVFLTIVEIGRHGKEFAVDFLCELDTIYTHVYVTCSLLWCTPCKRWWYLKPILKMSCFNDLIPGAGTWLPPSPWRCSSTFPELLRCSHLCHQISGEGESFSPGLEQPELGKVTFHIIGLICIYCSLFKLISFVSFPFPLLNSRTQATPSSVDYLSGFVL